jgi:hypothetical protein
MHIKADYSQKESFHANMRNAKTYLPTSQFDSAKTVIRLKARDSNFQHFVGGEKTERQRKKWQFWTWNFARKVQKCALFFALPSDKPARLIGPVMSM